MRSFSISATIRSLVLTSTLILFAFASVFAQQQSTDGATPLGLAPGAPAGSYSLSNFEDVNLFNGSLNVALPLIKIGGRGEAGYPLTLRVDHKWLVQKESAEGQPPINIYTPQPGWWTDTGWAPIYSPSTASSSFRETVCRKRKQNCSKPLKLVQPIATLILCWRVSVEKSKQRLNTALKKITSLKDIKDK